ncbi:MAG TPA: nucleotide sugar dehydrogenase [Nitrososphaeraceae archaeon]|nr:nucleotide sugar dehydrogenase [Nitrososphaeraceae archaeon]
MGIYNISIIGSGVVGTATGKGFHKMGHNVTFFDISKQRLMTLREEGYDVASSLRDTISQSDISFVCVNTPQTKYSNSISKNDSNNNINNNSINHDIDPIDEDLGKHQDLSQLLSVLRDISNVLNDDIINKKRLLAFRSTMLPGTMRHVVLDYLEANCGLKHGKDYDVLYNPEFLRQHSALEDFFTPDRIVIGQEFSGSASPLLDLYSHLTKNIILTGYEEAEMAKYASNCFLALKISYFNEIGMLCKKMGINGDLVSLAVSMDNRIGRYGTRGGRPYGGACFPKDTEAFASFARKMNVKPDLVETAISINNQMDNLNSAKLYVKEQLAKDHYIKEPEI